MVSVKPGKSEWLGPKAGGKGGSRGCRMGEDTDSGEGEEDFLPVGAL